MTWKFRPLIAAQILQLIVKWIISMFFDSKPKSPPPEKEEEQWDLKPMNFSDPIDDGSLRHEDILPETDSNESILN